MSRSHTIVPGYHQRWWVDTIAGAAKCIAVNILERVLREESEKCACVLDIL